MADPIDVQGALLPELSDVAMRVADATENTNDAARLLHQKLDAIRHISAVIRSVASQSKLLALNAAIEAGRAYNDGRAFGVIAAEMRALATRAEQGANEIEICIDDAFAAAAQNDYAVTALSSAVERGVVIVAQMVAAMTTPEAC